MCRTWFKVQTLKAHSAGEEPITIFLWAETCSEVYDIVSGKSQKRRISGIKYGHQHEIIALSAEEKRDLEKKIAKAERSGEISLFWARVKFFCEDWEFYHPRRKIWTRVIFHTDKGRIDTCIYATHYVPKKYAVSHTHRHFKTHENLRITESQFDVKVRKFKQFLERKGFKIVKHECNNITVPELRDIKTRIRDRFNAGQGNSLFEAEDFVFCENPHLMKEYVSNERYWLRKFAE